MSRDFRPSPASHERPPEGRGRRASALSFTFFTGALLASLCLSARAEAEPLYGSRESFWQGQVGMRSTFVTDPGFDPFATDNVLTTFSLGVSRTVFDSGAFSLAPGFFWDYGARSATARGISTSLATHRLGLALEGRYHFLPWIYGLARLTPGALSQRAQLNDPLAPAPYVAQSWSFALDASAGVAFLLGPQAAEASSPVRWWLATEGGYGYATSASLMMHPDVSSDDPRRTGDLDLGQLALRGAFFRLYGSVTF
jgi:hypothetical protein